MLHYTGTQYFSTHVSNTELDCDDQAAGARLWTQDPQCGELHMTGISGTVWCDKPDAPCIDTASHNGVRREVSYYIITSTDSTGTIFVNRVADGPDRTFSADGTITAQTIYTDGKLTELCKIDEKSGGKKYNCRDAIGVQYTKTNL
jgi:hypothetical protein